MATNAAANATTIVTEATKPATNARESERTNGVAGAR